MSRWESNVNSQRLCFIEYGSTITLTHYNNDHISLTYTRTWLTLHFHGNVPYEREGRLLWIQQVIVEESWRSRIDHHSALESHKFRVAWLIRWQPFEARVWRQVEVPISNIWKQRIQHSCLKMVKNKYPLPISVLKKKGLKRGLIAYLRRSAEETSNVGFSWNTSLTLWWY